MELLIYIALSIFIVSITWFLTDIINKPIKSSEGFKSNNNISYQEETYMTLEDNKCVSESPWYDHRVIGFCEDKKLTTPGKLVLPEYRNI